MIKLKESFHKLEAKSRLYQCKIPIIALTGGIATGKSEVSKLLKGYPIIDADANVKEIYKTQESLQFIKKEFPGAIKDNAIDFSFMRQQVFSDTKKKQTIEAYIYERLPQQFLTSLQELESPNFIIYDVPLLFEKELDKLVDLIVTVYCPRQEQFKRLLKRDRSSEELAHKILDSQIDIEEKKSRADFIIDNSRDLAALKKEVEQVFGQFIIC